MKISVVRSLVHYFRVFYGYAGSRLFLLCGIVLLGGLGESLGLTMLLPILDFERQLESPSRFTQIIHYLFQMVGVDVSLMNLLALLFFVFLLKAFFIFLQSVAVASITTDVVRSLRLGVFKKYMGMQYLYYTNTNLGYLTNVITTEVDRAVHGFGKYVDLLVGIIYIAVYSFMLISIDWRATAVALLFAILIFSVLRGLVRIARTLSMLVSEKNAEIQSLVMQVMYNFKYLKATQSFTKLFRQLESRIDALRSYQFKNGILDSIPSVLTEPLAVLLMSGLLLYHVVFRGQAMAEMVVVLIFFYRAFTRVFGFQTAWQKFWATIGGVEVLAELQPKLEQHQEASGGARLAGFNRELSLRSVHVRFKDREVLSGITITVPKNKVIGIAGASGAGKTTLFDVMVGLLRPQSGDVMIDGISFDDLDIGSLRARIGYVTQEPAIFNDTIANNISLWCDANTKEIGERIEKAARFANCEQFIRSTSNGYDTILGDKGVRLSGGQRQRIAIARELFKDVDILIFDEATSSLDTESEQLIQESIRALIGRQTMVIIAHRLSTLKNCDYIYLLEEGKIIEEGRFNDLYHNNYSRFSAMCRAQNI